MLVLWCSADEPTIRDLFSEILIASDVKHVVEPSTSKLPGGVKAGDVVLACGTTSLGVLKDLGLVPKGRTITSLREKPVTYNGVQYLITFNPTLAYRDYARRPELQWDLQLATRLHETGSLKPELGVYRYVDSLHELIEFVDSEYERTGTPVPVSCDLETKSFDPYVSDAWIIACSFTAVEGFSDVLYFDKGETLIPPSQKSDRGSEGYYEGLWRQVNWLLTSPKVSIRGANFKYDSNWIFHKWGISCTNQKFDTMLVGSLLNENRSNSLKLHAKIYTSLGGYEDDMDKYDFSALELVPKEELLEYVGTDSLATYQIAKVMKRELLKDKALANFYVKLLQPSAKVFEKMERTGVYIDKPYFDNLKVELDAEIAKLQQDMLSCLPNKMRIKHRESIAESIADGKSPFKPGILKEFLFTSSGLNLKPKMVTPKSKEPSTAMEHLLMFSDDPDAARFISYFKDMGSAQKTQSTYVVGFLQHLRDDGRFHPQYFLAAGDFGGSNDQGTNCLVADSLILTRRGRVRVVDLKVGDKVLTHTKSWRSITDLISNGVRGVWEVCTSSGRVLRCTANHKFLGPIGWVEAKDLGYGDRVFFNDGYREYDKTRWGITRVLSVRYVGLFPTYDATVEVDHSYVANGLITHNTGRTSASKPAVQTVPKRSKWAKKLRKGYIAPPGKKILQLDYSQGELRIVAVVAKEPTMIKAYASDQDLHAITAAKVSGYEFEDFMLLPEDVRDELRSGGKAGNFGLALDSSSRCLTRSIFTGEVAYILIPDVKVFHQLWDGEVWVNHDGVISQGDFYCITWDGVKATPDHKVWTEDGRKIELQEAAKEGAKLARTATDWGEAIPWGYSNGREQPSNKVRESQVLRFPTEDNVSVERGVLEHLGEVNEETPRDRFSRINGGVATAEHYSLNKKQADELSKMGFRVELGKVYDILNAGPNRRFTCNDKLVSNCYGMGAPGYRIFARNSYGVDMSEEEAYHQRGAFFDLYSRLLEWHKECKDFARRWGFVRSPLGRVRHLPLINSRDREVAAQAERQAVNSQIQSCLSDMMQLAMIYIDREYGQGLVDMFLMCHDSIAAYIPEEDDSVMWAKRLKGILENLPLERDFGFVSTLKFLADAEAGPTLADLKKLKNL